MQNKSLPPEKILFVLNPISGGKDKTLVITQINDFCITHSLDGIIYKTTGSKDQDEIKLKLAEHQCDTLVAIGGDGTVNLCASIIINTPIKLGIIPLGSGNGLSKDLKIPQNNVEEALKVILGASVINMDTLLANGHFFLHLCDIGFNAKIVKSYTSSNKRGLATYAYFMVKEFFNYKSSHFNIEIDDTIKFRVKAFMITAANSNQFGSNITINPNGKVDDGVFELVIIKAFPYKNLPKLIWQFMWKRIHFSPYSKIYEAKKVLIHHRRGKTLQVDGELLGRYKTIWVSINASSLKVIVPKN